jgi:hypothetical protein
MKTTHNVAGLVAIAMLLSVLPATAQPGDDLRALRQEVDALKQGQSAIQKDLQEIKELLRARPAPPAGRPMAPQAAAPPRDIPLDLTGAPVKGPTTAKVVMVEYTDYQ